MDKLKQKLYIVVLSLAVLLGTLIIAACHISENNTPSVTVPSQIESTASEPSVTEPSVTEPSVTEPSVTEPSVTEPSVTEPSVTEPSVTEPSVTEPSVTEPSVTEPSVTEPSVTEPSVTEPAQPKPDGSEMIGSLYTRDQLEALNGKSDGYGPGKSKNGARPPYATAFQKKYGKKFNAHAIAPDNGKVYFTFNHGYERDNLTTTVLDVLKEKNVKCVFFINHYYAKSAPDLVWRMINEGHIIANHASNHYDMGKLSVDEMVSEIMTMHNYMLEHFGYEMKFFRPPSGYFSDRLLAVAQSLGYTTVQWSYAYPDYEESEPPNPDSFLASVINSAHSGAIYQFHAVTASGVSIIGDAIDAIREKGYEFAQFTDEFE